MISVGNSLVAEYYAIFLMAMTIILNLFALSSIVHLINPELDIGTISTTQIVIAAVILTIIFYFSFVYKKKYLEISKVYEEEPEKLKKIGIFLVIGYLIFSFVLLIICLFLMTKKNRGEL
jgi:membrane protease YdiL (CAAX protease family)